MLLGNAALVANFSGLKPAHNVHSVVRCMDGCSKNIIYASKMHVGNTVQLKAYHFWLAVYAECKTKN